MNYKILLVIGMVATLFCTSCEFLEDTVLDDFSLSEDNRIPLNNIPDAIEAYLAENYPGVSVLEIELYEDEYEVLIEGGLELTFALDGTFLYSESEDEEDYIPLSEVPQVILDYLAENYPGQDILSAELDDDGYEVDIEGCLEVYFKPDGTFRYAEEDACDDDGDDDGDDGDDDGDDDDDDGDDEYYIPLSDVPQVILNYLAENYPNQDILYAERDEDEYEVSIEGCLEVYFTLNGAFRYAEQEDCDDDYIPQSAIPQVILDYIAANYPDAGILYAERDEDGYEVYIQGGWELYFDLNGNFLRAERD